MVAEKSELEAFAALDRICARRTADDETVVFDAGQGLQLLQFPHKGLLVLLSHLRSEFEKD